MPDPITSNQTRHEVRFEAEPGATRDIHGNAYISIRCTCGMSARIIGKIPDARKIALDHLGTAHGKPHPLIKIAERPTTTQENTMPKRIPVTRPHGKTTTIKIRPDRNGTGLFITAGPLLATITPENAYQLANQIADLLEQQERNDV